MRLRDADRGQSVQVGAVLLFGVLILLMATWQAVVVPAENEGVEFDHSRHVQDEVHELRNAVLSRGDGGTPTGVDVRLGTTYPPRVLFVNPGPPSGSLRTVGTTSDRVNVSVRNATAAGDAGDFWDGVTRNYTTGGMAYRPSYNRYENAPTTVYENSLLYNDFGERNLTLAGQTLIDGNRITLVTLNGSLSTTRTDSLTVDVRPITASRTRIGVVNATASRPLTISIPTQLSAQNWSTLLADQPRVDSVTRGASIPGTGLHRVDVHLTDGQYRLALARVGVGTDVNTSVPTAYLSKTRGNGTTVPENATTTLEVRVFDRFNNPASGVSVNASTARSASSVSVVSTSDPDGSIELRYSSPSDINGGAETDRVNVSFSMKPAAAGPSFHPDTPLNVTFDLTVDNTDGSGTRTGGGSAYNVSWQDPSGQPGTSDCDTSTCTLDASIVPTLTMVAETSPIADGAEVFYSVNDTATAGLQHERGETNSTGENETTLVPQNNGWVKVYASSGGDGTLIEINITNYAIEESVFVDSNTGELMTVNTNGKLTTYAQTGPPGIGPKQADLVGSGTTDIPFKPNSPQDLQVIETDNSTTVLDSNQINDAPIGVGDWDDDANVEVVYVRNDRLHEVEPGGSPNEIQKPVPPGPPHLPASAVAGVGDIDGDGDDEIVYVDGQDDLNYFDGQNVVKITASIGSTRAISTIADIDGDGREEVAVYDGNDDGLNLYQGTFPDGSVSSTDLGHSVGQAPMGTADWNGDGSMDVIYVDANQRMRYYDWDDDAGGFVTDGDGNQLQADSNTGAR